MIKSFPGILFLNGNVGLSPMQEFGYNFWNFLSFFLALPSDLLRYQSENRFPAWREILMMDPSRKINIGNHRGYHLYHRIISIYRRSLFTIFPYGPWHRPLLSARKSAFFSTPSSIVNYFLKIFTHYYFRSSASWVDYLILFNESTFRYNLKNSTSSKLPWILDKLNLSLYLLQMFLLIPQFLIDPIPPIAI